MNWKIVKHGEKGCGDVSMEGPERFVRFIFDDFKPKRPDHWAELFDAFGAKIAEKRAPATAS